MRPVLAILSSMVVVALHSPAASAANVTDVQGEVQLSNSGGPFKTISGPTTCTAGDVVRAVKDGSARVINPDGGIQTALPGSPAMCLGGPKSGTTTPPAPAAASSTAAAGGATPGSAAAGSAAAASSATGVSTTVIVGATIAVVAGVAGVVALTQKKSSASP